MYDWYFVPLADGVPHLLNFLGQMLEKKQCIVFDWCVVKEKVSQIWRVILFYHNWEKDFPSSHMMNAMEVVQCP